MTTRNVTTCTALMNRSPFIRYVLIARLTEEDLMNMVQNLCVKQQRDDDGAQATMFGTSRSKNG